MTATLQMAGHKKILRIFTKKPKKRRPECIYMVGRDQGGAAMRKGLNINDRDYQILDYLVRGPATEDFIFEKFFNTGNGNTRTRKRVMLRRLGKMEAENLVKGPSHRR